MKDLRTAELEKCVTWPQGTPTPEFLDWIAGRLVRVYGEPENTDFVLSLGERAQAMRNALLIEQGSDEE